MNVTSILDRLSRLVRARGEWNPQSLYTGLFQVGIESEQALEAVLLVPIAFGRSLLEDLPLSFTDDFFCFSSAGHLIIEGRLSEETIFVTARALGRDSFDPRVFELLALASPEVGFVRDALARRIRRMDVLRLPLVFFWEKPTNHGLVSAQQVLADFVPHE